MPLDLSKDIPLPAVRPVYGFRPWVGCVALSPDARTLVVGGPARKGGEPSKVVRLDVRTGTEVDELLVGNAPVRSVAFTSDGAWFAALTDDGLWVFCAETGLDEPPVQIAFGNGSALCAHPTKPLLMLYSATEECLLAYDPATRVQAELCHVSGSCRIVCSPDGRTLAVLSGYGNLAVVDLDSGEIRMGMLHPDKSFPPQDLNSAVFRADGAVLYVGGLDVFAVDVATLEARSLLRTEGSAYGLALGCGGAVLVVACANERTEVRSLSARLSFHDVRDGREIGGAWNGVAAPRDLIPFGSDQYLAVSGCPPSGPNEECPIILDFGSPNFGLGDSDPAWWAPL